MSRTTWRWIGALALVALASFGLAACSDDDGDADQTTDETTEESGSGDTVTVGSTDLGDVLVDGQGNTLYLFTDDAEGASSCSGACTDTWPPLTVDGEITVGGDLDSSLFTTFEREGGDQQVAVDGHPLYTYSGDSAPGDANGQDVGGTWFVVGPDGSAISDAGTEGGG